MILDKTIKKNCFQMEINMRLGPYEISMVKIFFEIS